MLKRVLAWQSARFACVDAWLVDLGPSIRGLSIVRPPIFRSSIFTSSIPSSSMHLASLSGSLSDACVVIADACSLSIAFASCSIRRDVFVARLYFPQPSACPLTTFLAQDGDLDRILTEMSGELLVSHFCVWCGTQATYVIPKHVLI